MRLFRVTSWTTALRNFQSEVPKKGNRGADGGKEDREEYTFMSVACLSPIQIQS